jgi:hypothetical protein
MPSAIIRNPHNTPSELELSAKMSVAASSLYVAAASSMSVAANPMSAAASSIQPD